jgi:endo-1,4-beta-D-glucanase Y
MKINKILLLASGMCILVNTSYAEQLADNELENGSLSGLTNNISSPFNGVSLFSNGDNVQLNTQLSGVPGKFRIDIRGASNNSSAAGISVYLGDTRIGETTFTGTSASISSISFNLDSTPSNSTLKFQLESDNNSNDTYLDWYELHRTGDIPPLPSAPVLPDEGAYDSGEYRNMFVEFGYSAAEVTARLNAVYDQLFHSKDLEDEAIFIPVGDDMAYIWDVHNNDIRSEGMSYGMMMALQMDRQDDFNKLWKWAYTYSLNKSGQHKGYFAWQVGTDGNKKDAAPAPDGEEYFATALFFAAHRWGNDSGIYNYEAQANQILRDMFGNGVTHYVSGEEVEYSLFNHEAKQVVFSPVGEETSNHTDTSYHLPAFYELWSRWADNNNSFWAELAVVSRQHFKDAAHPTTGLTPDYAYFDGRPHSATTSYKDTFQYDAWRVIGNVAMDYAWWKKDEWQVTQAKRLQTFFKSQGVGTNASLYELNGDPYNNKNEHSSGLVAMNAVASLASDSQDAWLFVEEFWNTPVPEDRYRYYNGSLYMFGMLAMSGNYRIYCPNNECDATTPPVDQNPVNRAPIANNDSATTTEGGSVSKNVVNNDTDADGDVLSISTYTQAGNGSVSQNGDSLVYTPNTNFTGTDSFSYGVTDGTLSDTATVTVTVTAEGEEPVDPVDPVDPEVPGDVVEMEGGVISPSYREAISNPYSGVILYGNNEEVSFSTNLSAGDYTVEVSGSSSNASAAGISLYVDGAKVGDTSFSGTTRTIQSISFTLNSSASELTFILETDTGQNDTLMDWFTISNGTGTTDPVDPASIAIPGVLQAENFTSESGTQTENTSDNGGGLNVGYIQSGDYLTFNINVEKAGVYKVEARVASDTSGGDIDLLVGSTNIGTLAVTNTGGWQTWQTVTTSVTLEAGEQVLSTNFTNGNNYLFNLNYLTFTQSGSTSPDVQPVTVKVEAEDYDRFSDTTSGNSGNSYRSDDVDVEATSDKDGGYNIGWTDSGEWIEFDIDFTGGDYKIDTRVASINSNGKFTIDLNGNNLISTTSVLSTGAWQNWTTKTSNIVTIPSGTQRIRVNIVNGGFNLNWITFIAQ